METAATPTQCQCESTKCEHGTAPCPNDAATVPTKTIYGTYRLCAACDHNLPAQYRDDNPDIAPGPWRAEGWEYLVVNDANGNTLALVPGGNYGLKTAKATAALMAAAFDLLKELERVERIIGPLFEPYGAAARQAKGKITPAYQLLLDMRAAIAKAKGVR